MPWSFACLKYMPFENTEGKGKIARKEQFLLLPLCFLSIWSTFYHFHHVRNCRLLTPSVWKRLKIITWERVKTLLSNNPEVLQC